MKMHCIIDHLQNDILKSEDWNIFHFTLNTCVVI